MSAWRFAVATMSSSAILFCTAKIVRDPGWWRRGRRRYKFV